MLRWFNRQPKSARAHAVQGFWRATVPPDPKCEIDAIRWVCADTETSGLDPDVDRLISIGACAVQGGQLDLSAALEVVLRQDRLSAVDNVLIHGIGHGSQANGIEEASAIETYLRFSRQDVVVGFHTLFDVRMLQRVAHSALGVRYRPLYIDLAFLLPALLPQIGPAPQDLDGWLERLQLPVFARHQALADAMAAAELLLVCLDRARRKDLRTLGDMLSLQRARMDEHALPTL